MAKGKAAAAHSAGLSDQSFTPEEQAAFDSMAAPPANDPAPAPAPTPDQAPKAPAPTPAPAADKTPPAADPKAAEGDKNKMVPIGAMHEEREERKKAEARLTDLEGKYNQTQADNAKLTERMAAILEKLTPKQEPPKEEVIPNFDTDPAGWIAGTMKKTGKSLEEVQAYIKEQQAAQTRQTEQNQQRQTLNEFISYAANQEPEFRKANPDYDDAGRFLQDSRVAELGMLGYSQAEIGQMLQAERLTIAAQAKQHGKNAPEIIYNLAKARGYVKAAPPPPPPAVPAPAVPAVDPAKALQNRREAMEQGQSLSDVEGTAPPAMTAERLALLSDAEFDNWMATDLGRSLMG